MPAWFEHLNQDERNERTFWYLDADSPSHLGWQVTLLFYAALHYVDAYLHHVVGANIAHRRSHAGRSRLVNRYLGTLYYASYTKLQDDSENARYNAFPFAPSDVQALYAGEFSRIRGHIRTALGI